MPQSHSLPPLPLSSLFLTHWPATCSLFLLPITRSSVLCASCYMSMSLVIKNALWLSHVLVYWIKENPNIIVINTNNITFISLCPYILLLVVYLTVPGEDFKDTADSYQLYDVRYYSDTLTFRYVFCTQRHFNSFLLCLCLCYLHSESLVFGMKVV